MDDETFLKAFEDCTLTREEWTHEAHVRMAWLYARRTDSLENLLEKLRTGIRATNAVLSTDPTLYHETVTCAFGTLIRNRALSPGAPDTWPEFQNAHPEFFDRHSPVLHRHYSRELLESDDARLSYLPPDLVSLSVV